MSADETDWAAPSTNTGMLPDQHGRIVGTHRVLAEYARHYNEHRPHQSREQRPPLHEPGQPVDVPARTTRRQVVHDLINEYHRAA